MVGPPESLSGAPPQWRYLSLLLTQGLWTSLRALRLPEASGPGEGVAGPAETPGHPPLHLLALGDSIVAGVGVENSQEALPAQLAGALAGASGQAVRWYARGSNGCRSAGLVLSLDSLAPDLSPPSVVLVSNGINDVTRPVTLAAVLNGMRDAIEALEARFPESLVVCPGLPPLGAFPALPEPLRAVLGRRAMAVDAAFARWTAKRQRVLHLPFSQAVLPGEFAADGYHPNAAGVRRWAQLLCAPVLAALERLAVSGPDKVVNG